MTLSIDIPDGLYPQIEDAFLAQYGAPSGLTNPQKRQFVKARFIEYLREVTKAHRAELAAQGARNTSVGETDAMFAELPIT